jgi:DNA-binding CsgD family transcriptional regulator
VYHFAVSADGLAEAGKYLGDVIVDPAEWPNILERIGSAAGASGAALFRSDNRTPDIPRTASAIECYDNYFATGWHTHDTLAERGLPLLANGAKVISDQNVVTADEMRRLDFYNEVLVPFGFQWFAGIGFTAGSALWAMLILRSPRQGPFEQHDKRVVAQLSRRLTEVATLSAAVGGVVLGSTLNALHLVGRPALVLDRLGYVLDMNAGTELIFDEEASVRSRRLTVRDQWARAALNAFTDQLRTTPDTAALPVAPIVVRRLLKPPLVIRILPIDGAARTPFLGARALLIFSAIDPKPAADTTLISDVFRLTRAEAQVAALVAQGKSLAEIAAQRGSAAVTVRNQVKTIFAKTGTHRQSELVALLSRL